MNYTHKKKLGDYGEQLVSNFIELKGFIVQKKQFRTAVGEIDIIAYDNKTLVCIEVKTRSSSYFATSQVITTTKQKRMIKAASYYCIKYKHQGVVRFDVAIVEMNHRDTPDIIYHHNAFQSDDSWLF